MLSTILKTYDISLSCIWLQKVARETPEFAREHDLEFNEQHHRWMKQGTEESSTQEISEVQEIKPEEIKATPTWLPANSVKLEVGHTVKIGPKSKAKDLVGKESKIITEYIQTVKM